MPRALPTAPLTAARLAAYGAVSTAAFGLVVLHAFLSRPNFYSAGVLLARSNGSMLVLLNFGIFCALILGKCAQKAFFGQLRAVEIEHLYERSWYAVTEGLLAMTIFRDSFDASFVLLFGTLLFLKVFHWLCEDRVDFMEQAPSLSRLFHVRMVCVLWTLLCLDIFLVAFACEIILLHKQQVGVMILFASEFMILTAGLLRTTAKYIINCHDLRHAEPWEGKSMYVFFVDLATDFMKLLIYLGFFLLILTYYGFPLNMVRDVFLTARSFFSRVRHFFRYRAATRNMESRFPNASSAELNATDKTCIICREEMAEGLAATTREDGAAAGGANAQAEQIRPRGPNETPKKLPCGHIFHFHCLRSWLERQQACPTCRRTVFTDSQRESSTNRPAAGAAPAPAPAPLEAQNRLRPPPAPGQAGQPPATGTNQPASGRPSRIHAEPQRLSLRDYLEQLAADTRQVRQSADEQAARAAQVGATTAAFPPRTDVPGASATPSSSSAAPARHTEPGPYSTLSSVPTSNILLQPDPFAPWQPATRSVPPRSPTDNRQWSVDTPQLGAVWTLRGQVPVAEHASSTYDGLPPPPWAVRRGPAGSSAEQHGPQASRSTRSKISSPKGSTSTSAAQSGPAPTSASGAFAQNGTAARHEVSPRMERSSLPNADSQETASSDPANAREAARAAALKRFAALSSASTEAKPLVASDTGTLTQPRPASPQSTAAVKGANESNTSAEYGGRDLVPLFDPQQIPDFEQRYRRHLPYHLSVPEPSANIAVRLAHGLTNIDSAGFRDNLPSLNNLSPEQLQRLSRDTREGLEERLRVLAQVQGTLWTAVDELTKALSVLPESDNVAESTGMTPTPPVSSVARTDAPGETLQADEDAKGKAPAEGVNAPAK